MDDYKVSIYDEAFDELKSDFDEILSRTLDNMKGKGADAATITLKLSISTEDTTWFGKNGGAEQVTVPTFKHDISSVMQVKDKLSGMMPGEMALVHNDETGEWTLRPYDDGQLSIYDGKDLLDVLAPVEDEYEYEAPED